MKLITKAKPAPRPSAYLPLELIVDHPDMNQRELNKEWVAELAESIRNKGLDTPLFVWTGDEDSKEMEIGGKTHPASYLVAGNHRRQALKMIRKQDPAAFAKLFPNGIPVIKREGEIRDMLTLQLRENVARNNPTMEDILPMMIRLRDEFKMKNGKIAREIGKSDSYVSEVFSVEDELGEEGVSEVLKGKVSAKHAIKAAKEAKAARKAGKDVDRKGLIDKAKSKTESQRASGRERDEKRVSFKKAWSVYKALPEMDEDKKLPILEKMCAYVAGESDKFPKELKLESAKKSAAEDEDEE